MLFLNPVIIGSACCVMGSPEPIGVGNGFRRPRPPNRACGSPAHGSPVGGFLIGIGSPASRLQS
jgi:hypothetical protein